MTHGDEVRIARLDGVEPGPAPAPTARWDVADSGPDAPDGQAVTSAPVAALPGTDVEVAAAGVPGPAVVADLISSTPSTDPPFTADLAVTGGSGATPVGRTARLGEMPRGGGRARRRPDAGPGPSSSDEDAAEAGDRPPRPRRRGGPKQIDPDADPVAAAREICLRLLTDRARTRHELAQALSCRGVPDETAASVLERFDDVGLIDDAAFAGQWVRSRHNHRGLARRAIAMELRRKGVDDEVASEALGEVDADSETRRARELVDRKLRSLTVDTPEQHTSAARRLVGMLARRGYGAGTAYGVVREALAAHGADADELGSEPADD